jgi:MtN3 and saliva related transmembrane protein
MSISFLGFIAGILTTIAFLPQVLMAWQTKRTKDISLPMYVTSVTGIGLWIVYGVFIKDFNIILFNCFTFLLASTILMLKLRHG